MSLVRPMMDCRRKRRDSYLEMSADIPIRTDKVPQHVAIIMDGNGRWAQMRNLPRQEGHIEGVKAVRRITRAACKIGIRYLTLYAFSTENWGRPKEEVSALMALLVSCLHNEMPLFMENGIRLRVIGQEEVFAPEVKAALDEALAKTAGNTRMDLVLALSYSARWELTEAVRKLAGEVREGRLEPGDIDASSISRVLATSFMPDPDLLIRTSGEYRISNFLLWQIAYSELFFSPVLWPDFTEDMFYGAIADFQKRDRRFGKLSSSNQSKS